MKSSNSSIPIKIFLYKRFFNLFGLIIIINLIVVSITAIYQCAAINKIYTSGLYKALEEDQNELLNEIILNEKRSIKNHLKIIKNRLQVDGVKFTSKKMEEKIGNTTNYNFIQPLKISLKEPYKTNQASLYIYYENTIKKLVFSHIFSMILIMFVISIILSSIVFLWVFNATKKVLISPLNQIALSLKNKDPSDSNEWPNEIIIDELLQFKLAQDNYIQVRMQHMSLMSELSANLAHDIRSPIMCMTSILKDLSSEVSSQKLKILEESIQNIRDIANNLLVRYKEPHYLKNDRVLPIKIEDGNKPRYILISSIIDFIASQKRYEWQDNICYFSVEIDEQAKNKWIYGSPNELKRAFSNLLNNAYEALEEERNIYLSLSFQDNKLFCIIKDTGKGIDTLKIQAAINGKSFKKNGHGLGLSGAKKIMETLKGELLLKSSAGKGTEVQLVFTHLSKPSWFPERIYVDKKNVAILDDDLSVHNLWRNITYSLDFNIMHFTEMDKFSLWFDTLTNKENIILIFDHELNQGSTTGLDLLEKIKPNKRGYLITSHAEEVIIQKRCSAAGIWLLPKALFECIEFVDTHHSKTFR